MVSTEYTILSTAIQELQNGEKEMETEVLMTDPFMKTNHGNWCQGSKQALAMLQYGAATTNSDLNLSRKKYL